MTDDLTPTERRIGEALSQPTTYWFDGVTYSAANRTTIVERLVDDPDTVPVFTEKTLNTLQGLFAWGAFGQAKEGFAVLCDVLADIAERQGKSVRR